MSPWALFGILMIVVVITWLFMAVWDDTIDIERRRERHARGDWWVWDGDAWQPLELDHRDER